MTRSFRGSLLVVAVLVASGCGDSDFPPLYPVTGKVVFENGSPLGYGMIDFESESEPRLRGTARIETDGRLVDVCTNLTNGKSAPGLKAGSHKVSVLKSVTESRRDEGSNPIPTKYTSLTTTDLRITVSPPKADVTLTLVPAKK
jgi:hypothetical protein